jgi:cleavage and polyadenylation specificity factor subunit 1
VEYSCPGQPPTILQPTGSWNASTAHSKQPSCATRTNIGEALPLVLLGIRTAFKTHLHAPVAELVYGEPLRIPGELLTPTTDPVDPAHLVTQLRQHMVHLRPVPAARHSSPATFVHKELHSCTHVFLRQIALRRAREPPYSGPYQVLSRRQKTMKLLVRSMPVALSTDRVKPAYILNEADCKNTPSNDYPASTVPSPPPTPT